MTNTKIYDSIEELTLYRWDKYTATKDNNWLLHDYDGRGKKVKSKDLSDAENIIVDQYFKAIDDRSFSNKLQKWAKIDSLKLKYNICNELLARMYAGFGDCQMELRYLIIDELSKWGLKFPKLNSSLGDLELINKYLNALEGIKTQIGIIQNEIIDNSRKESQSLQKQLQIVALGLGYNYRLNPKEITLKEWIEMCKMLEEKAKQN